MARAGPTRVSLPGGGLASDCHCHAGRGAEKGPRMGEAGRFSQGPTALGTTVWHYEYFAFPRECECHSKHACVFLFIIKSYSAEWSRPNECLLAWDCGRKPLNALATERTVVRTSSGVEWLGICQSRGQMELDGFNPWPWKAPRAQETKPVHHKYCGPRAWARGTAAEAAERTPARATKTQRTESKQH